MNSVDIVRMLPTDVLVVHQSYSNILLKPTPQIKLSRMQTDDTVLPIKMYTNLLGLLSYTVVHQTIGIFQPLPILSVYTDSILQKRKLFSWVDHHLKQNGKI